jgi:hypothetical protein
MRREWHVSEKKKVDYFFVAILILSTSLIPFRIFRFARKRSLRPMRTMKRSRSIKNAKARCAIQPDLVALSSGGDALTPRMGRQASA